MKLTPILRFGMASAAIMACSSPAFAQDADAEAESAPAWDFSANVGVVSDYRFRGISLSDKDPAVQGGLDLGHESGFFIGTWASSIEEYGGSDVELDLYAGYAGEAGAVEYSVTALAYVYPGGDDVNYYELMATVGTSVGPASVGAEVAWVPDQDNFGGDNFYLAGNVEVPIGESPVSLFGHVGWEDGDVYDNKWDWEAGVSYSRGPITATVSYVDTNYSGINESGRLAKAGVVATLIASF